MKAQPEIADSFAGASIGSEGGEMRLGKNGGRIEILPGVLADKQFVTLQNILPSDPPPIPEDEIQVTPIVKCTPEDFQLNKPATVELPHCMDESDKPHTLEVFLHEGMYGSVKMPFYLTTWRDISSCQVDLKR